MIDESIFREYDIRGIVPEQINEFSIKAIASAIARKCSDERVNELALGRDGRLSGEEILTSAFKRIAIPWNQYCECRHSNKPSSLFCCKKTYLKSGVMITGSHNPKNYNGFKIVINDLPVSGIEMLDLISNKPDLKTLDLKSLKKI